MYRLIFVFLIFSISSNTHASIPKCPSSVGTLTSKEHLNKSILSMFRYFNQPSRIHRKTKHAIANILSKYTNPSTTSQKEADNMVVKLLQLPEFPDLQENQGDILRSQIVRDILDSIESFKFYHRIYIEEQIQSFQQMINVKILRRQPGDGMFPIYKMDSIKSNITRFGTAPSTRRDSLQQSVYEVDITNLRAIHPVPVPDRANSGNVLESTLRLISREGYDLLYPITIVVMPDQSLRILDGHHRVKAMELLGAITVPAKIRVWTEMKLSERRHYIYNIFIPYAKLYPAFHYKLLEDHTIYD